MIFLVVCNWLFCWVFLFVLCRATDVFGVFLMCVGVNLWVFTFFLCVVWVGWCGVDLEVVI